MKNLFYIGLGGLAIYFYLQSRKKQQLSGKQKVQAAGDAAKQIVENTQFFIPDLSDRKLYEQEKKTSCK
jgi:hypothetical protein